MKEMALSLTVSSMWYPCFLITRTGFIHLHSHNTLYTLLTSMKTFPCRNLCLRTCAFQSKRLRSRPSPHIEGKSFFSWVYLSREKIYFCCFDNNKNRRNKKRKATKAAGFTCGYKKCLCSVFSFISTATCYQYVKYFRNILLALNLSHLQLK